MSRPLQRIINLSDLDKAGMEPWPIPRGDWDVTVHGDPEYLGRWLYLSEDRRVAVGIERCGPCHVTGTHSGEVCFYLEGETQANPPDGEPYTIKAGDYCYFPPGMKDVWDIQKRHTKLLIIHSDRPLPLPEGPSARR